MAIRCIKTCTKWNIHVATIAIRYHRTGAGNLFPLHAEAPLDKPLSARVRRQEGGDSVSMPWQASRYLHQQALLC